MKLYKVLCYVHANSGPNVISAYKTKKAAQSRYNKAMKSNCYEKVEIVEVAA